MVRLVAPAGGDPLASGTFMGCANMPLPTLRVLLGPGDRCHALTPHDQRYRGCPGPGRTGPVSFMRGAPPSLWTATTLWDALTENGMAAAGWQANLQRHPSRCSGCVLSSSTGGVSGQSGTTSLSEGFSRQRQVPGCGGTRQMGKTFPKTDRHAPGQLPPVCMRVPYC